MLLASHPFTFVFTAISPSEFTESMSLIFTEVSDIFLPISPPQMAFSMHFIILPCPRVLLIVTPRVNSLPTDLIHLEVPIIHRPICKCQLPVAVLLSIVVLSLIYSTIGPGLHAEAVLLVFLPLTLILCSISMSVSTLSISFIIKPLSFVHIFICMEQLPRSIGLIIDPAPNILRPIRPLLRALSISLPVPPFPCIYRSTGQCGRIAPLPHSIPLPMLRAGLGLRVQLGLHGLIGASIVGIGVLLELADRLSGGADVIEAVLVLRVGAAEGFGVLIVLHGLLHLVLVDSLDDVGGAGCLLRVLALTTLKHSSTIAHAYNI